MDISFQCNKCGQYIAIDESGAGQLVDCPKCGTPLEVPYKSKPLDKDAAHLASTPSQRETKPCPFCAEPIKTEAKVCRFCGYDLVTGKPSRSQPKSTVAGASNLLPKILTALIVIAVIAGGFFAYYFWRDQQRVKAEAPFFAAAKEAMDEAHSLQSAIEAGLNYQAYGERILALAAKTDRLLRAADETGFANLKPEGIQLCKLVGEVRDQHTHAREMWRIKIYDESPIYYPWEAERNLHADWQTATEMLAEADKVFAKLKEN